MAREHGMRRLRDSDDRPKWYDTRARKGGGGAIDLAMHVLGLTFVDAVKSLNKLASVCGPDHP